MIKETRMKKPNKNERSNQSVYMSPSMRASNRVASGRRNPGHKTLKLQQVKPCLVLVLNKSQIKKVRYGTARAPLYKQKETTRLTAPLSDIPRVRELQTMAKAGLGNLHVVGNHSVWHDASITI